MAYLFCRILAFALLCLSGIRADQIPLAEDVCAHPPYTIHIFSKAPLVIYISNFLTPKERDHLQEIT